MIGEVKKSGNDGGQKFEEFKTDPDLEGTTIQMEESKTGPQALSSSDSTAESNSANQPKSSSFSETIGQKM